MNAKRAKALRRAAKKTSAAIVNKVTGERINLTTRQIYREAKRKQ